ncbi:MAG: Uma2 family endonuclease [Thermomicrobiales bacterium]|nr:Uma2 family endonuclease [Thermomicrobiales bacterium]
MVATRPLTIAEFATEPLEGRWELIDGERIVVTPAAGSSSFIASRLGHHLNSYIDEHPIGHVFSADAGFVLFPDRATVRSPDVAFVSRSRLPEIPETFIPMPPDLAVEILSPTDRLADALAKAAMYLDAGVPLVWLIDPRKRTATIFRQEELPVTTSEDGVLEGEGVLPGFTLPLAKLWP